ncbi:MAG: hypothetical protein Kow0068_11120 [Marinilabiliales bacterium]
MEKRLCLNCSEPITGRADKKFCSDYCRNSYNNQQNKDETNALRRINYILRKNRKILIELTPTGKTKLHKSKLDEKGFNYDYFTSLYVTKTGNQYFFCYDYGYIKLDNDYYVLVKKDLE